MGFLSRIYYASRQLVWGDSNSDTETTASRNLTLPGPTVASQSAKGPFLQALGVEHGGPVNFSLRVLNENFSAASGPEVYLEGSTIRVEASLRASLGNFPKLFVEECYGADAPYQSQTRRIYVIADNHGCLHSRDPELTWFRKTDSTVIFTLPAFLMTGESEEIYIHCLLTAWSHKLPTSPGKKMCTLDSATSRWKNLDEPSKTSVCNCCDSYCPLEAPPDGSLKEFPSEGRPRRKVIGPLRVRRDVPWFEGRCHTVKKMLLVSVAFVCSCILAALFVGVLVALVLAVLRYSCTGGGCRRQRTRKEQPPFHTELQTVVGACAETEDTEKESNLDYCKLNSDSPDTA